MALFGMMKSRPGQVSFDLDFSSEDLMSGRGGRLFINRYSADQLMRMLSEHKVLLHIQQKGYHGIELRLDLNDPFVHSAFLEGKYGDRPEKMLLMELHLRVVHNVGELKLSTTKEDMTPGQMLFVDFLHEMPNLNLFACEFLRLQSPAETFAERGRMPLPGQDHPGLGCMRQMGNVLAQMAKECCCDAVMNAPQHFHNAFLYSRGGFSYANAEVQGAFDAMVSDLADELTKHSLAVVATAVLQGRLFMRSRIPGVPARRVIWAPEEQIDPLSKRFRKFFTTNGYKRIRSKCRDVAKGRFFIDWDCPLASSEELAQALSLRHTMVYETEGMPDPTFSSSGSSSGSSLSSSPDA